MPAYTLYVDSVNQVPEYITDNCIVARSMDEAVEITQLNKPDKIVFGHGHFCEDFLDWVLEHIPRTPVEYLYDVELNPRTKGRFD